MKTNRALLTIFFIVFIDLFGFSLILPMLPFVAEKFGTKPAMIGLLAASYSFFQLISSPILGALSDRFGRKKLLLISQAGSAVGFVLLGLAPNLGILFLSRIIDGITGGNISIAQAYIADVTDKKNRAKGMGMIGAAFGLGFIIGPAVGGILSSFGFWAPAFLAAGFSLITVISTALFLKETVNVSERKKLKSTGISLAEIRKAFRTYPVGILLIAFLFLNLAFSVMQGTFALWTERKFDYGPTANGWLFAYIGIISVLVQLKILPYLLQKFSEKKLLVSSVFVLGTGLLLIPLLAHPGLLFVSLFFLPLGNGISNPAIQSIASENVKPSDYGETLGILQSAGSLGRIFGPIIGGWMFEFLGPDSMFFFGSGIVFIMFIYLAKKLS